MTSLQKIAFVSPVWTTWQHRLMAGALRYADTHPRILIRGFAPVKDLVATAMEVQSWGAAGVFGHLEHADLSQFLQSLACPLPVVNAALTQERSGVVTLVGDFAAFVETAVGHLRQLGVRCLAVLVIEEGPEVS